MFLLQVVNALYLYKPSALFRVTIAV